MRQDIPLGRVVEGKITPKPRPSKRLFENWRFVAHRTGASSATLPQGPLAGGGRGCYDLARGCLKRRLPRSCEAWLEDLPP